MIDRNDALTVIGLILLAAGLWLVAPALALSVVGVLLAVAGLLGSRAAAQRKKEK